MALWSPMGTVAPVAAMHTGITATQEIQRYLLQPSSVTPNLGSGSLLLEPSCYLQKELRYEVQIWQADRYCQVPEHRIKIAGTTQTDYTKKMKNRQPWTESRRVWASRSRRGGEHPCTRRWANVQRCRRWAWCRCRPSRNCCLRSAAVASCPSVCQYLSTRHLAFICTNELGDRQSSHPVKNPASIFWQFFRGVARCCLPRFQGQPQHLKYQNRI